MSDLPHPDERNGVEAERSLRRKALSTTHPNVGDENSITGLTTAVMNVVTQRGRTDIGAGTHFSAELLTELEKTGWKIERQTKEERKGIAEYWREKEAAEGRRPE